jgi:hypothetical protein
VFVIFKNELCVHLLGRQGLGTFLPNDVVTRTVLSMEKLVTTEVDGDTNKVAQIDESRIVEKLYLLPDSPIPISSSCFWNSSGRTGRLEISAKSVRVHYP